MPLLASAHEAYVLPYKFFWQTMRDGTSLRAFTALNNPQNLHLTLVIVGCTLVGLIANFLLRRTRLGTKMHLFLERYARFGTHFIRIAIAVAFFFSAASYTFLGPELHLDLVPYAHLVQIALYAMSVMIFLGIFTELAAAMGLILYLVGWFVFGSYLLTYLNYFGELVVLLLFGIRAFSIDRLLFGRLRRFRTFEKHETTIVRVAYGLALMYAAVTVKLLHPELTVTVIHDWHLTQFHWLFPSDPILVTFGAGVVEFIIGLFIAVGFELRLTVLVSLFYITLSLLYFRELVWPHLLLYGISFNLLVQPERFTLDRILFKRRTRA